MKTMLAIMMLFSGIIGVICFTNIFPSSMSSPRFAVQQNLIRRSSSPMGRAYLAARIAKTLRHLGYPTKRTIQNDAEGGSPAILLECPKFSQRAIDRFIDRGILADLYFESFDRVDFSNGSRTWSHELNESHRRDHSQGRLYLFASELTGAECDQVNKQVLETHSLPASPESSNPTPPKARSGPQNPGNPLQHPG
ncbi:MAG: hypothetical protein A2139_12380 [Desulfobacca sp. RBG_16_60_12]|nr:MAG: hypothetical protein A2139_12380 [Desulfobacca sp. RBG_16_60_12]